jgi:methylamine dehydrogenase accessory protein MauD
VSDALLVSNVLLWIAVVALAAVVFALLRQIGVLHERVSPAGALMLGDGPRVGEAAPELEVESWSGQRLRLGGVDPDGRATLLVFVSPSCPVCKALLPALEAVRREQARQLRAVLVSDGARSEHEAFVREHRLERQLYVLSAPLGIRYRVAKLPYAVLVDEAGIVRAAGLVNSREHLESLFEARERGVPSIQAWLAAAHGERDVA